MKNRVTGLFVLWMMSAGLILSGCGNAETFFYGETLQGQEAFPEREEEDKSRTTEDRIDIDRAPNVEAASGDAPDVPDAQGEMIYVQVCGAVANPGVYGLSEGARVFEAVELAGGLLEDAAPDAVNQAQKVSDGELIRIPTKAEWEEICEAGGDASVMGDAISIPGEDSKAESSDGLIDLNTADAALLMTLPGIGESKAESIVRYRETNGPFTRVEDVKNVSGIKDGLFQKIKDKIRV
jgi:competence protein ComEA